MPENKKRFVFYSPRLGNFIGGRDREDAGGAELQLALLIGELEKRGNSIHLIVQCDHPLNSPHPCFNLDPSVFKKGGALRKAKLYARLLRWLIAVRPDYLITRSPSNYVILLGICAFLLSGKFMFFASSDNNFVRKKFPVHINWFAYCLGLLLSHRVFVQNNFQEGTAARLLFLSRKKIITLLNMISLPEYRAVDKPAGDFFLWIGRFIKDKQLEAYLHMARGLPHRAFKIIGYCPGVDAAYEQGLLRRIQVLDNVELLGFVGHKDLAAHIVRSRALVNTSTREGFSNTFLEAWSCGVPVVTLGIDPSGIITSHGLGLVYDGIDALLQDSAFEQKIESISGQKLFDYVWRHHRSEVFVKSFLEHLGG